MVNRMVVIIAAVAVILVGVGIHFAISDNKAGSQQLSVFSADAYLQESNSLLSSFKNST